MTATAPPPSDLDRIIAACKKQTRHPYYPSIILYPGRREGEVGIKPNRAQDGSKIPEQDPPTYCTLDQAKEALEALELKKALAERDRYNYGVVFQTWYENLWEILRLRVRNPGEPVHFLASGSNGSSKSEFAGWLVCKAIMQVKRKPFMFLTDDEPKSKAVQQQKVYSWLPETFHNERGRQKTDAETKFGWNGAGAFTENEFCIRGNVAKFRFWSALVTSMEGPRPYMVWSDEEIPLEWVEAVKRRLLTEAESSNPFLKEWRALLEQKKLDPYLAFPISRIGDLMAGVHLVTWTPSQGRTDTVSRFQDNGAVMQTIEADKELLPRRDKNGKVLGGERMDRLIYGKDPTYATRMMYAWENPMGGNWTALRKECIQRGSPAYTRWRVYGITEKSGGTPFNNFNTQVHVRPRSWLPRVGTWYMVVDPVVSGSKCWFMIWFKVAGEHQGKYISPGDIVVCHEYPQCDDLIPGVGLPDAWATPGGKESRGIPGNIQQAIRGGLREKAAEIRRIEEKLGAWECEQDKERKPGPIIVPAGNRIMDSRAANTEKENESESETLIELMHAHGLEFVPAGRGSGAQVGEAYIAPGEQMINDRLSYDVEKCKLDPETGWMCVSAHDGRGPRLWIMDHCTNLLEAMVNYKGIANGPRNSHFKDPIDVLRYGIISRPEHFDLSKSVSYVT